MQTLEEKQQDGMTGAGPETEFHTELFGFNRVEVLSYIERISAANAEKARALEDTIAALQKDLTGVRRQGSTLAQKAKQVFNELENQKKRAEDAVAEAAALRTEVDKANDEIAAVRSRLFAREQENAALKSDNARLSETVDDLTRALTRRGAPLPTGQNASASGSSGDQALLQQAQLKARDILRAADAQATAHIEMAKEDAAAIVAQAKVEKSKAKAGLAESADGIAASIAVLKAQLAAVDAKILAATGDLQKATDAACPRLARRWSVSLKMRPPRSRSRPNRQRPQRRRSPLRPVNTLCRSMRRTLYGRGGAFGTGRFPLLRRTANTTDMCAPAGKKTPITALCAACAMKMNCATVFMKRNGFVRRPCAAYATMKRCGNRSTRAAAARTIARLMRPRRRAVILCMHPGGTTGLTERPPWGVTEERPLCRRERRISRRQRPPDGTLQSSSPWRPCRPLCRPRQRNRSRSCSRRPLKPPAHATAQRMAGRCRGAT